MAAPKSKPPKNLINPLSLISFAIVIIIQKKIHLLVKKLLAPATTPVNIDLNPWLIL
jgi:hypothetical protein